MPTLLYVGGNLQTFCKLGEYLEALGYEILATNSASSALTIFTTRYVDLAVVDCHMRAEHGDTVSSAMKKLQPCTPVIAISEQYNLPALLIEFVEILDFPSGEVDVLRGTVLSLALAALANDRMKSAIATAYETTESVHLA